MYVTEFEEYDPSAKNKYPKIDGQYILPNALEEKLQFYGSKFDKRLINPFGYKDNQKGRFIKLKEAAKILPKQLIHSNRKRLLKILSVYGMELITIRLPVYCPKRNCVYDGQFCSFLVADQCSDIIYNHYLQLAESKKTTDNSAEIELTIELLRILADSLDINSKVPLSDVNFDHGGYIQYTYFVRSISSKCRKHVEKYLQYVGLKIVKVRCYTFSESKGEIVLPPRSTRFIVPNNYKNIVVVIESYYLQIAKENENSHFSN